MKILIVNKSDLSIAHKFEADAIDQSKWGGPWGDPNITSHVQCSPSLDWDCISIEDQGGVLVAIEDEDLVAAKEVITWIKMRAERDNRLNACDWTQLPDSPLNAQDKATWSAYRQELRDLPENTLDPAAPVWPDTPDEQI